MAENEGTEEVIEETPTEVASEEPAATPAGEDLAARLEAVEGALQKVGTASSPDQLQALFTAVQGLQAQVEAIKSTTVGEQADAPTDRTTDLDELAKDPRGMIRKEAGAAVLKGLQMLVPHLKAQAEQMRDLILDDHAKSIDQEFGKGAFQELFAPELAAVVDKMPIEMQSSKQHMDAVMSAVFGQVMRNQEKFGKLQERKSSVMKAANQPVGMMSGSRAIGRGPSLSQGEKEFLAALSRNGFQMDAKEYIAAREKGKTEKDWAQPRGGKS